MYKALIVVAALAVSGCWFDNPRPIISTPPAACASIVPASWSQGVEAEPIPNVPDITAYLNKPLTEQVAALIAAPYAQAYAGADMRLSMANGRTKDAIAIFRQCESVVNQARPK